MPPITAAQREERRKARDERIKGRSTNTPEDEKATTAGPPPTKKSPKLDLLRVKLDRSYATVGMFVSPLSRWWPFLGPLGQGMREYSNELAGSWIPYLEENPKMLKRVEDFTTVSALGELVGVHVMVLAKATPNQQVQEALKAQKKAEEDLVKEMNLRESMAATPGGMPARDMSSGGPGDTIRVPNNPATSATSPVSPIDIKPDRPDIVTHTAGTKAAIVTPEQMGVQIFGTQQGGYDYSAAPPPNGRGIVG
jgi:hypothetical protein